MQKSPTQFFTILSIFFLVNILLLNGCQNNGNSNANRANKNSANSNATAKKQASDNIEELLNLVKLPVVPEEVVWLEEENAGKRKVTAVLRYEPETLPNIVSLLEKYKQNDHSEVGVESWFPEELMAQAQLSGVETIKGTGFGANEFFNIPYGSGKITRIEGTNYFVLELQAN